MRDGGGVTIKGYLEGDFYGNRIGLYHDSGSYINWHKIMHTLYQWHGFDIVVPLNKIYPLGEIV